MRDIEGYGYLGVATAMIGMLTYHKHYPGGTQFILVKDNLYQSIF